MSRKTVMVGLCVMQVLFWLTPIFAQVPDTLWTRTYGGTAADYGRSIQQCLDGGYVVAGWTRSFGAGCEDVYIMKTNASGDTMWTKTYGGGLYDYGHSIKQTTDGGYVIVGETYSFAPGGYCDVYLIRTNINGDSLWARTYGGALWDVGSSVQQTHDGGYVIAGYTATSFVAGGTDVYFLKIDSNGDTVWTKNYGGDQTDLAHCVQQCYDDGYIIAGATASFGAGGLDVYLIRTDYNGDTLWTRTYGGAIEDYAYSVQQTSDSGYILAGWTESYVRDWKICIY